MSAAPTSGSLDAVERAALALLNAVRTARGSSLSASDIFQPPAPGVSLVELCNEFLLAKAYAGRSESYLALSLVQLRNFVKGRAARPVASITAKEIEQFIYGHPKWGPVTQRNQLRTIRTLLEFGVARGLIVGNVAKGIDLPTLDNEPPAIHTPEQVAIVLEKARAQDANLCRWLAVRYFAGLRGSEAASLAEAQIQAGRGFIEVTAAKSKTRRRRLVTIQPALAAWLEIGGRLPLGDVNTKRWKLTSALPFPWPSNVTRHSFVSYHLAHFQSAAKTALEAGHTEQILFNHYRELVTPEAATEFWAIRPK